jgi:hypothetical protein
VRNLLLAVDSADLEGWSADVPRIVEETYLIDLCQVWTESTMHAEHAAVHERAKCEVVEHLAAPTPDVRRAVLSYALVVKAVYLSDLPTLMVPPNERYTIRVPNLEC